MAKLVLSKRETQIALSVAAEVDPEIYAEAEVRNVIHKLKASADRGDTSISIRRWS